MDAQQQAAPADEVADGAGGEGADHHAEQRVAPDGACLRRCQCPLRVPQQGGDHGAVDHQVVAVEHQTDETDADNPCGRCAAVETRCGAIVSVT